MSDSCGIIGLPNVGKSTLFSLLSKKKVDIANYPFCTIEPNKGVVKVIDDRFKQLVALFRPAKEVPKAMHIVDIAGLVVGAAEGAGLGNQFLSHVRSTKVLVHVLRFFDDTNVTHVSGTIDPIRDMKIIEAELILSDMQMIENVLLRLQKKLKHQDAFTQKRTSILKEILLSLERGIPARSIIDEMNDMDQECIKEYDFLTSKPVLYVANISEDWLMNDILWQDERKQFLLKIPEKNALIVPISVKVEEEMEYMSTSEQEYFRNILSVKQGGIDALLNGAYFLLNYITFYTASSQEVRGWSIEKGNTALIAASKIHTDIAHHFIAADVISSEELVKYGSYESAKAAGKIRREGKEYIIQDGEVINFLHAA